MEERIEVILVNESDEAIGVMEKMEAHQCPHLHRAFSVFIFNSKNELLLQQRAMGKYHSPGLWTNTCCGHPSPGTNTLESAANRLIEEMGLRCKLFPAFNFTYQAAVGNGLIEHELDHVFIGNCDDKPILNPKEAADFVYLSFEATKNKINAQPELFTEWFKLVFERVEEFVKRKEQH